VGCTCPPVANSARSRSGSSPACASSTKVFAGLPVESSKRSSSVALSTSVTSLLDLFVVGRRFIQKGLEQGSLTRRLGSRSPSRRPSSPSKGLVSLCAPPRIGIFWGPQDLDHRLAVRGTGLVEVVVAGLGSNSTRRL
jgi:hypothetical protein